MTISRDAYQDLVKENERLKEDIAALAEHVNDSDDKLNHAWEDNAAMSRDILACQGKLLIVGAVAEAARSQHSPGGAECPEPQSPCAMCNAIRAYESYPALAAPGVRMILADITKERKE